MSQKNLSLSSLANRIDLTLLITTILLCLIGVFMIYSATFLDENVLIRNLWKKQLLFFVIALVLISIVLSIHYRHFVNLSLVFYILVLSLLLTVYFSGDTVYGSKRWLSFGALRIQPSEIAKIVVILIYSFFLGTLERSNVLSFRVIFYPTLFLIPLAILVYKQPDLGTSIVIILIAVIILLAIGVTRRLLFSFLFIGCASIPLSWNYLLKPYQQQRILTLLSPESGTLGTQWQSKQSIIAIGSGKIMGKGHLGGTQSSLQFLPEKHSDFIFSVICEEYGFIGAIAILMLLAIIVQRCFDISMKATDEHGKILALGIGILFALQIVFNIGMTIGIFPIVGITLPLISYGGSSFITSIIAIGLVMSVDLRRKTF
ncbi:MAG: rod shape-determining protein RodA [Nitrospinota bacterium]|nr:rod shape-determining protein RodA [Nitrospinota bacterium]